MRNQTNWLPTKWFGLSTSCQGFKSPIQTTIKGYLKKGREENQKIHPSSAKCILENRSGPECQKMAPSFTKGPGFPLNCAALWFHVQSQQRYCSCPQTTLEHGILHQFDGRMSNSLGLFEGPRYHKKRKTWLCQGNW